jgi:hypothetical protein
MRLEANAHKPLWEMIIAGFYSYNGRWPNPSALMMMMMPFNCSYRNKNEPDEQEAVSTFPSTVCYTYSVLYGT